MSRLCTILLLAVVSFSCSRYPTSQAYNEQYAHLKSPSRSCREMIESDYFLVILVEARHLDYSNNRSLFRTLVKHPSDGSKNSDVGHAWIYLRGVVDGIPVEIEGGHSGESGAFQPKYFEGVMDRVEAGSDNPIEYLWEVQQDGYFQQGRGRHYPTYAAKVDLTEEQFWEIISFMDPGSYCYGRYAITGNQCSSFVSRIASIAGLSIPCEVTIPIDKQLTLRDGRYTLWNDPQYSLITVSTPDIVEKSLMEAVQKGKAEYALEWYRRTHPKPCGERLRNCWETLILFPSRMQRVLYFY